MNILRILTPQAWAISAALVLIIAASGWWLVIGGPAMDRRHAAEARAIAIQADARTGAAIDANRITEAAHGAATASEALSRETANVIRTTPGADQALDPRLNGAGRQRVCERQSYRNRPECTVQRSSGAIPAK